MLRLVQVLGILAGVVFLAARFSCLSEVLTWSHQSLGGDLYQQVRVRDFREPMSPEATTPIIYGAPSESTEIVLIGDSHSRFSRTRPSLAVQLHEYFPRLRSCAATTIHPRFFDPSDMLRLQRIRPGAVKVVVWESAERAVADVAVRKIPQPFHAWDTTWKFDFVQTARNINVRWFTGSEDGYQYLLLNMIGIRDAAEFWNTLRFRITGTLPGSIGAWLSSPPHLFLAQELASIPPVVPEMPTSYLQKRDSVLVEAIAASLAEARDRLRRDFGAELVILVVPAKASLLYAALRHDYDDFVPRVNRALGRRGIRTIDSWGALDRMGEKATLRTDTHLSGAAYDVMTDSVAAAIREITSRGEARAR